MASNCTGSHVFTNRPIQNYNDLMLHASEVYQCLYRPASNSSTSTHGHMSSAPFAHCRDCMGVSTDEEYSLKRFPSRLFTKRLMHGSFFVCKFFGLESHSLLFRCSSCRPPSTTIGAYGSDAQQSVCTHGEERRS